MKDLKSIVNVSDFKEPYRSIAKILSVEDVIKIEEIYNGKQIYFCKIDNIEYDYFELYKQLGEEKTKKVIELYEGSRIYFPKLSNTCKEKIKKMIRAEFTGWNYWQLSDKYGYSERHIRKIVHGLEKNKRQMKGQLSLFDKNC